MDKSKISSMEFCLDKDSDVKPLFDKTWALFKKTSIEHKLETFIGISMARQAMMHVFESEEGFVIAPDDMKQTFIEATIIASDLPKRDDFHHIANGMMFFGLWAFCVYQQDKETQIHIEQELSDARRELKGKDGKSI